MSDLDHTAAWAADNHGDSSRLGVNGFCRGGRDVWLYAAHNPRLKAAVSWYGVLDGKTSTIQPQTALDVVDKVHCPVLGLYGSKDAANPLPLIHEAEAKAKAAGKTVSIVIYQNAPHGFHADYRPSYREADAKDGWQRALAWFKQYGVA
jgi:carboxymethylenebutenolidase